MKKLLLLSLTAAFGVSGYAQEALMPVQVGNNISLTTMPAETKPSFDAKVTGLSDTIPYASTAMTTPSQQGPLNRDFAQPYDSGAFYGMNASGYKGFGQFFDLKFDQGGTADSSIRVLGIVTRWQGRVSTSSTRQINFNVWSTATTKQAITGMNKWFITGLPNTSLKNQNFDAKTLVAASFNQNNPTGFVPAYFTTPLTGINQGVYVGYTVNYTWGSTAPDTFGVMRVTQGSLPNIYSVDQASKDTLLQPNVVIQDQGGTWRSVAYQMNFGAPDMVMFPIIQLDCPNCHLSLNGVKANDLTFHGSYPNPANNFTNVVLSLKETADVTINVMDMTGKFISKIAQKGMASGKNEVRIETANLAAGNYIYTIETSNGGTMASQFSVVK